MNATISWTLTWVSHCPAGRLVLLGNLVVVLPHCATHSCSTNPNANPTMSQSSNKAWHIDILMSDYIAFDKVRCSHPRGVGGWSGSSCAEIPDSVRAGGSYAIENWQFQSTLLEVSDAKSKLLALVVPVSNEQSSAPFSPFALLECVQQPSRLSGVPGTRDIFGYSYSKSQPQRERNSYV